MDLTLTRQPAVGDAIAGDLVIDGVPYCATLERTSKAIPLGRYRVELTVSQRATEGELWSPDPAHRLPLVEGVTGRSGIRIHAANEPAELEGCIALGQATAGGTRLVNSRLRVSAFVALLADAETRGEESWLTVTEVEGVF